MSGIAGMPEFAGQAKLPDDGAGERDRVVRAIVLGILSGLAGAAVWVAFGAATKHEIGFVAVGVGLLVGWAMARVRAGWAGLPFVAAAIALVAVLLGDVVLDVYLQADAEGIGFGEALGTTLTTPALARDLFGAYFSPIDALLWVIATTSAYRVVSASVLGVRGGPAADAGPPGRLYGPHA